MNDIDKWCAEQCGVVLGESTENQTWHNGGIKFYWWEINGIITGGDWIIQDPRCREIVKERFKIDTTWTTNNDWYCFVELDKDDYLVEKRGKTIAEAEIQCIQSIYEARDE